MAIRGRMGVRSEGFRPAGGDAAGRPVVFKTNAPVPSNQPAGRARAEAAGIKPKAPGFSRHRNDKGCKS